jgi:hypothetical protein
MHKFKLFVFLAFLVCSVSLVYGQNMTDDMKEWESLSKASMNPDMAYAHSGPILAAGNFDRNADGRVDLVVADRNGDGRGDYWATDRNFDGRTDDFQYDRNFDGRIDQWEYDIDHDGISDKIYVDADRDGKAEMYATLNPITRTYTWYGNMSTTQAASQVSFPPLSSSRNYTGGRAADSN